MNKFFKKINKDAFVFTEKGLHLIRGANGEGKSLVLKKLFFEHIGQISLMNQNNEQLDPSKTVLENLTMNQIEEEEVLFFVKEYEKEYLLYKKAKELSGGEKRLLTFFRTAFSPMPVLFFDEPTNDLDYRSVKIILNILEKLKMKKCVVIVSHDGRIKNADYTYRVAKKKLIAEQEISKESISFEAKRLTLPLDKGRKLFALFAFCLVMGFAFYTVQKNGTTENDTSYNKLPKNEVYLASQFSTNTANYGADGVSTIVLREVLHLKYQKSEVPLGLSIKEAEEVVPLEYYNVKTRNYRAVEGDPKIRLNEVLTEAKVIKNKHEPFVEFFIKNDLVNQNVLIKGYDVSKLQDDANRAMAVYIAVRFSIFGMLMIAALYFVLVYINEKNHKPLLKNQYFYGFDLQDLILGRLRTYGFYQYRKLQIIMVAALASLAYFLTKSWVSIGCMVASFAFYLLMIALLKQQIKMIGKMRLYQNDH